MQSRPEPHWTVMGPAGESCSYQSHHRHHAGSPSDCGRWVECYTTAALFRASYRYFSSVIDKCYFGTFQWWPPPYYQPHHSVYKNVSHYFSMNETHNNQASIIIQDMWLKMLYWGRYWPPNWICKTFLERFISCRNTCRVGTPVVWGHISCRNTCRVGTPVVWGHISCRDTCHVGTYHVGTPVV